MCLISFRAHSHQRVTHLASRAMTKEMSKRVQRDRNNKLPMSSRTPGSHGCSGSDLGSGCDGLSSSCANTNWTKTEFHIVFQNRRCAITSSESKTTTRGGTVPGLTHNTKTFLHVPDLSQQNVFAQPSKQACEVALLCPGHNHPRKCHYRTPPTPARDRLCVSQCISYRLFCLPPLFAPRFCRECFRPSPARFVQLTPRTQCILWLSLHA